MATYTLTGTCYDVEGSPVADAEVHIFYTPTDEELAQITSDVSGIYTISTLPIEGPFYAVAYFAGTPDIAGATVNTLTGILNLTTAPSLRFDEATNSQLLALLEEF